MLPANADAKTVLKQRLAPFLAAGAGTWARLSGRSGNRFQIIILHDVPSTQHDALRGVLHYVQQNHGFLTPADAVQRLANPHSALSSSAESYPCLVTFDDGFASAVPVARDILADFGIKAVFFACPGLIDLPIEDQAEVVLKNVFRGAAPSTAMPALMSWDDLRGLASNGHVIGAHGSKHLRLAALSSSEIEDEVVGAGTRLAQQLGTFPEWYAYAFGDIASISRSAMQTIRRHYRYCRTGVRGSNGADNPAGILNAQEIDLDAGNQYHRAILNSALDMRYLFARRTIRQYADIR